MRTERIIGVELIDGDSRLRCWLEGVDELESGGGRIVNVASTEGLGATKGMSPYTASKTGVGAVIPVVGGMTAQNT